MGASSWHYYTPYQTDPEAALQTLRNRVFESGDYGDVIGGLAGMSTGLFAPDEERARALARRAGQDPDSPAWRQVVEQGRRLQHAVETGDVAGLSAAERETAERMRALQAVVRQFGDAAPRRPAGERPGSIDELLEEAAEEGTHSILDIQSTGPELDFAVAAPLPEEAVRDVFGTDRPTREQVEEMWDDVSDGLERWQAYYLTVYRDGVPDEYAFIGCSGD